MGSARQKAVRESGKRLPTSVAHFAKGVGDRISVAVDRIGSNIRAGEIAGVSDEQISRWKQGNPKPSLYGLMALADASRLSFLWLATGKGPRDSAADSSHVLGTQQEQGGVPVLHANPKDVVPDRAFVSVPLLDVQASAGRGLIPHDEEITSYLALEAAFLRSLGISPSYARIIDVMGDSMRPTLHSSDRVLVDTSIDHVVDEGLYAVVLGGALLIKRVQIQPSGGIVLKSDNKSANYDDVLIKPDDLYDLRIAGRVRLRIHLM